MHTSTSEEGYEHHSTPGVRAEVGARESRPLRVLLVDDGAPSSKTFRRLLLGVPDGRYVLDRVTTHEHALEAMAVDEHDVYVLSHLVGARTGFDVLSWLKTKGVQVPVVFVPGAADHATGVTAVTSGASCYVVEDSIESGFLDHSLSHAFEQTRALARLSDAGIAVDSDTSMRTLQFFRIAEKLREPTTAILNASERSLEFDTPADARSSFGLIEEKANVLLTLANDLNDLTVLGEGRLQFHTEAFSLRSLFPHDGQPDDSASRTRYPWTSIEIDPDVPDAVIGDSGRLRLAIMSLVETVVARSSTERAAVNIRLEDRSPGAVTLRFTIEAGAKVDDLDSGASSVSDDFDGNLGALFAGDSLGMLGAHETVSRMGGSVAVSHDASRAASVQFTIRLQTSDEATDSLPIPDEHVRAEPRILVIADEAEVRHSIGSSLSEAELPFQVSPSVEAWRAGRLMSDDAGAMPSLVVIECVQDAFDVCDQFNAAVSERIPVVVVVGAEEHGDTTRCRERGVRGYLARPLAANDLVDVIRSSMAATASGDTTTLVTRQWLREGRSSLRVLVVDDSTTNRFLLTRMLEQRGHSTAIACDGSEAVEASQRESFDVVLMDVMMPVMDGLQSTRLIREMRTSSEVRPLIIAVSAFADQANIDRAEDAGMDGFLAKPIDPDDLFVVIEQHMPAALTRAE